MDQAVLRAMMPAAASWPILVARSCPVIDRAVVGERGSRDDGGSPRQHDPDGIREGGIDGVSSTAVAVSAPSVPPEVASLYLPLAVMRPRTEPTG